MFRLCCFLPTNSGFEEVFRVHHREEGLCDPLQYVQIRRHCSESKRGKRSLI